MGCHLRHLHHTFDSAEVVLAKTSTAVLCCVACRAATLCTTRHGTAQGCTLSTQPTAMSGGNSHWTTGSATGEQGAAACERNCGWGCNCGWGWKGVHLELQRICKVVIKVCRRRRSRSGHTADNGCIAAGPYRACRQYPGRPEHRCRRQAKCVQGCKWMSMQ